jgi:hypothetical protein
MDRHPGGFSEISACGKAVPDLYEKRALNRFFESFFKTDRVSREKLRGLAQTA